jgi:hypothetical protein
MKKKIFNSLILIVITCKSIAQEEFVLPHAKQITKFSFTQLSGGIIVLKAAIDQIPDSLNFILDTGSGGISLDSSTVEELHLISEKSDRTIRGIAGMKNVKFTYHHSLKLPGLSVDSLDFHINDYDLLTSVYGVKVDGIIGFSFLRRYVVRIDYDNLKIEIYQPGLIKYPKGGYLLTPNFSSLPLQTAILKDEKIIESRFIFDTGAGLCFLLSQDFVEDSNFISKKRKLYPTQAEGLGGKKIMNLTVLKELNIGPYKFKRIPVHIFEDAYNVTSYPILGGLIGNDLLRRFNVILNYPEQRIHLKPNNHYFDGFDYSYTGLGIYMVDGEIKVIDIIPNSPGQKAGFKTDDVIIAIDNKITKNIQVFKSVLQNAGTKVKVVVMRNNQLYVLHLEIKNIQK